MGEQDQVVDGNGADLIPVEQHLKRDEKLRVALNLPNPLADWPGWE